MGDEPIVEAPAAPPLPPNYQFTQHSTQAETDSVTESAFRALGDTQVRVPAQVLVALLVDNAQTSTRLAMTQDMMAERTAFAEQMHLMLERNAQLQAELAIMEIRQQVSASLTAGMVERADLIARMTTHPSGRSLPEGCVDEGKTGAPVELHAIQEDLANIRRQIALLKRQQPVPFAPSYVGSSNAADVSSYPWRTAQVSPSPYCPVSPSLPACSLPIPMPNPVPACPTTALASPTYSPMDEASGDNSRPVNEPGTTIK
jgi:hypothetical protein